MVIAFCLMGIGILFGLASFSADTNSAVQQTVQYLGFVVAAVFVCCGCIITKIHKVLVRLEEQNNLFKHLINSGHINGKEEKVVLAKPLWEK